MYYIKEDMPDVKYVATLIKRKERISPNYAFANVVAQYEDNIIHKFLLRTLKYYTNIGFSCNFTRN